MPQKYRVKLSDGRTFDVVTEGGPPSEADVMKQLGLAASPANGEPRPALPSAVGVLPSVIPGVSLGDAADLGVGALQGIGTTIRGGGRLLRKIPGVDAVSKSIGELNLPVNLEPSTPLQAAGKTAEQILEFFAPTGATTKGTAWILGKLAPHMAQAPAAAKAILGVLPRMATEGASAAGVTALQGGDPVTVGALGAAGPVVGTAVGGGAGPLVSAARKGVSRFLGATGNAYRAESRIAESGVLSRGLVGTRQGVLNQAVEHAGQPAAAGRQATFGTAGREIQRVEQVTAAAHPGDVIPSRSVTDTLDAIIRRSSRTDNTGAIVPRLGMESRVKAAQEIRDYVAGYGSHLSVESAAELKRDFQALANAGKQFLADDPTKAKAWIAKKASTSIRRELLSVNPDLEKVWAEYGFWAGLRDVLQHTLDTTRPQQNWGRNMLAATWAAGAAGGGAGFATGSPIEGTAAGLATAALSRAVQSPTWKLVSAQMKSHIADALVSGNASKLGFFLNRAVPGAAAQATR